MFRTGLTQKSPHVDEAGCYNIAAAIDDMRMRRQAIRGDGRSKVADKSIGDENAAKRFGRLLRINLAVH